MLDEWIKSLNSIASEFIVSISDITDSIGNVEKLDEVANRYYIIRPSTTSKLLKRLQSLPINIY